MKSSVHRIRLRRLFLAVLGLLLVSQFTGDPVRTAAGQASSLSVILSNPSCVQALPASGSCSLKFSYVAASGSNPSLSRLEFLVNGKLRVYMAGFFEAGAFLSEPMLPGGLAVECGKPNDGGLADYGKAYSLSVNAYMADGTSASDSINVFCPAYDGKTYLPFMRK